MKTQLITLAAILLMGLNVSAKTYTPDNVNVNEMLTLTIEEAPLTIEAWMTDDDSWNRERDHELSIEDWMHNDLLWNVKTNDLVKSEKVGSRIFHTYKMKVEKEEVLTIEDWMTNDKLWNL